MSNDNKLVARIVEENNELKSQLDTIQGALDKASEKLSDYQAIGNVDEVKSAVERTKVSEEALGEVETKLAETEAKLEELVSVVKDELGSDDPEDKDAVEVVKEISEKMHVILDKHQSLMSINESLGDPEGAVLAISKSGVDASRLADIFEEYGTAEEMADSIDKATVALEEVEEEKKLSSMAEVGAEYGLDEDAVKTLVAKFNIESPDDFREFFELTNRTKVEVENPEVQMGESFNKILGGGAFAKRRQIDEGYKGNYQRQVTHGEGNSPERAARLL